MNHAPFMHRCLALASLGRRKVGNGALVGAVLVREGKIIADGFHQEYGSAHAERQLLENFDQEIYSPDVLYVNLEPCCHTGKTLPCTDIIIQRGIKHVVYGMCDPDPRVQGRGIEILRAAGVTVEGPMERALCERLNRGFVSLRTKQRPWITLKGAFTRDGRTANPDGSHLKITSPEQDIWSHTYLRSQTDAILVGVQTVVNDDPILDERLCKNYETKIDGALYEKEKIEQKKRSVILPYRIVLDKNLNIPLPSGLIQKNGERTIIITSPGKSESESGKLLSKFGVRIIEIPLQSGLFEFSELWKSLTTPAPGFPGVTSILVEGGQKTWKSFKDAGVVDEEVVLVGKNI